MRIDRIRPSRNIWVITVLLVRTQGKLRTRWRETAAQLPFALLGCVPAHWGSSAFPPLWLCSDLPHRRWRLVTCFFKSACLFSKPLLLSSRPQHWVLVHLPASVSSQRLLALFLKGHIFLIFIYIIYLYIIFLKVRGWEYSWEWRPLVSLQWCKQNGEGTRKNPQQHVNLTSAPWLFCFLNLLHQAHYYGGSKMTLHKKSALLRFFATSSWQFLLSLYLSGTGGGRGHLKEHLSH